jgi:nickel superoxide dismutase
MKRLAIAILVLPVLSAGHLQTASAHCEVPCGIYADQRRFEEMLEDTATIAKGIAQINELIAGMEDGPSALSVNQVVRWVNTKESHATNTQHIIAQYFMTQRIKPDAEGYTKKLTAAHAVMQAAMKCKQNADPKTAEVLKKAILDFYRAYEGKEPNLHD